MENPVTDVAGNLLFCVDGSTWAVWRVLPHESARSTGRQLRELYDRTVTLMKSLRGEVMIASLCEQVHAHAIVQRCLQGIDLDANPHWAETVHNAWDQLDTLDVLGRSYWLAKPLSGHGWKDAAQAMLRATSAALGDQLGLPARPASAAAVAAGRERARVAAQELGGAIPLRPATEAELLWWLCRAPVRGVDEPQLDRAAAVHNTGATVRRGSGRARLTTLRSCVFDEGGRTDPAEGRLGWGPFGLLNRRFVKCVTPHDDGAIASYQAYLVLAEMPRAFTFPGHEILARLADIGFGVDYALRITARSNDDARAANRRRTRDLMSQDEEHAGDTAGVPADVVSAQEEIQHKNARLGASSTEIDLEVGVIAGVWGATARDADARAKALRQAFLGGEYRWERPLGGQRQLYQALLPGSRTPMVVRECSQNLLATDAAMLLPVSATDFGDPAGALFGLTVDGGAITPFLLDPTYGPTHDSSGGIAVIGELGAGKSVILKNVAAVVRLMLDGRVIVIDRTRSREWPPRCPGTRRSSTSSIPASTTGPTRPSCGTPATRCASSARPASPAPVSPRRSSPRGWTWSPTPPSETRSAAASTPSAATQTRPVTDLSTHSASTVPATRPPAPWPTGSSGFGATRSPARSSTPTSPRSTYSRRTWSCSAPTKSPCRAHWR
jgi:hypothetical protein